MTEVKELTELDLLLKETKRQLEGIDEGILTESLSKVSLSNYRVNIYNTQIQISHKENNDDNYTEELSRIINEVVEERITTLKQIYLKYAMAFQIITTKHELKKVVRTKEDKLYESFYVLQDEVRKKRLNLLKYRVTN